MKTKLLSVLALGAILFTACNNDDDQTPVVNDGQVRFSSGIVTSAHTLKISGDDGDIWSMNDRIGIYMVENGQPLGTTSVVGEADNIPYGPVSEAKSTEFKPANGYSPIYYPVNEPKVDFFAYYPYQAPLTNFTIPVDLSDQSKQTDLYILVSQRADNGGAGYDKTNDSPVNFKFDHQLVKVLINVTKGTGVTDLSGLEVKIKGMDTKANFSLANRDLSEVGTVADIVPYRNGTTYQYEAVLLPLDAFTAEHVVEFTLDGNTYSWIMSDNTGTSGSVDKLEIAKKYTFNVKLQKTKIEVSATINAWQSVGAVDGTAN